MHLIISRKGFDSDNGECPSPIFADDSMFSLPIPDHTDQVRYGELAWRGRRIGDVVQELTGGRYGPSSSAHLDPDLRPEMLARKPGWRPVLGQTNEAQGHLRNEGVGVGDLFLFFGLFQRVDDNLKWIGEPMHALWGWLQVAEVAPVDSVVRPGLAGSWEWASAHPHLAHEPNPRNSLYFPPFGLWSD